jgi:hypothetical protein
MGRFQTVGFWRKEALKRTFGLLPRSRPFTVLPMRHGRTANDLYYVILHQAYSESSQLRDRQEDEYEFEKQ